MRDGGLPLPLALQYLILMIWRAFDLNFVMISLLASKWQDFKHKGLQFHIIKQLKNGHSNFKTWYFEAREDIITKFKSQALDIIRIKYWKACVSGNPPFLLTALRKIAILGLKMIFLILFCSRLYSGGPECLMRYFEQEKLNATS